MKPATRVLATLLTCAAIGSLALSAQAGITIYRYDAMGRLTKASSATGNQANQTDVAYTFDARGNRTQKAVTYGSQPAPVAVDDNIGLAILWLDEIEEVVALSGCVNVLLNDSDLDNDTLSVTAGRQISATQCYEEIIPLSELSGYTDSFNYTVSDGRGGTDTGAVNVAY